MAQEKPTSVRLSDADQKDIEELVKKGIYTHEADALRAVIRKGIEAVKKERGLM